MGITSALVLFAVIWFMVFFIVLPLRNETQGDTGEIVPGTHASSPVNPNLKRKVKWTTIAAILIWLPCYFIIDNGLIPISSLVYLDGIDDSY